MSSISSGQRPDEILKLMGDIAAFVSTNSVAVWACRP
jgi:hypothetical protein